MRLILCIVNLQVSDDTTLVHCHAGRGRTGVLIALDFAVHQLKNLQTVNVEVKVLNENKFVSHLKLLKKPI